ncbi:MAG: serine/threonine-protein phosphatase [Deltaproteobacteria bacterium]|nr:MAG: serine/threonine-protein phosphatase [Deltaproteobacteria bacterium]
MSDSAAGTDITVALYGRTDVGIVRTSNEDHFAVADLDGDARPTAGGDVAGPVTVAVRERGPLVVVCDGMGGAAAGEVASALAVEVVVDRMREAPRAADRQELARHLRRAVRAANRAVFDKSHSHWKLRGMGTTLSAVAMFGGELVLAQVGDSRAYLFRNGALVQITRDQSVVAALLQAGRITPDEADRFAASNIILQALGVQEDVDVALSLAPLRRGDRLLVCSDGLHGPVDDDEIAEVLAAHADPRAAADALIERARDAGGPDNITAVVADFAGEGLPAPAGPDDLPRFMEIDPAEDGERAITTTSHVARRLAARAGVTDDPGPRPIPATDQHAAIDDGGDGDAPAVPRRLGAAWLLAAIAVAAAAALWLWGR